MTHELCYWQAELAAGRNPEVARRKRDELRDLFAPSMLRMNNALAAARLVFSERVTDRADEVLEMINAHMNDISLRFDLDRSHLLLGQLTAAIREETLFSEVLSYQRNLFKPPRGE